jgi:putative phage-type endonuclease
MTQGTESWHQDRLGKVTASRVSDVMAKTKSGYSTSRTNYMAQLVCERMTGQREDGFTSAAMNWGTEHELLARALYELTTGNTVTEVGFIDHPEIEMAGASPDGTVGLFGLVEIKCPNTATHIETLLTRQIDAKYIAQMQFQMACTGRQWCDFVSYDPRIGELELCVIRVDFDPEFVTNMETEIRQFLSELNSKIEKLEALK